MRLFPILTALLVSAVLYAVVMERERLVGFAEGFRPPAEAPGETALDVGDEPIEAVPAGAERVQVEVRAETSGLITSQPIRAGAFVDEGQLLCEIAPGARAAALAEAEARLLEAQARLPEAEAQLPAARARQSEAEAMLAAARIDSNAATRLSESGFGSETRAASASATVSAAEAALEGAVAGIQTAQAAVQSAQSGIRAAEAALMRAEQEISNLQIFAPFEGLLESDTAELGSLTISDGQTADIIIASEGLMAHLLPSSALTLNDDGVLGLRIVDEEQIARFAPVTFLRDNAQGVLLSGLPERAEVIVVGQEFVTDGTPVEPHYGDMTQ